MRKKLLAVLLASTMIMQPLSTVGATEFEDGIQSEEVFEFEDEESLDAGQEFEAEPEVGTNSAEVRTGKPSEDAIQMGDDVWFTYDASTSTGTISGIGAMWDYLKDGVTLDGKHENPLKKNSPHTLVIEDGITHVSDYLMAGNAEKVILGKDVRYIGKNAFYGNTYLKMINMGENIQEIGDNCFFWCNNLKEIVLPDSITKLGEGCFTRCNKLEKITLPSSLKEVPSGCFGGCSSLKNISFTESITKIGSDAFDSCSGLETIDLPESITIIGERAFADCSGLNNIDLPEGLKAIGFGAFTGCIKLNNVVVPNQVKSIWGVFANNSRLQSVSLPEGIEDISSAFANCIRLQEITIPQSVIRLDNAFSGCDNLTKIKGYTCSGAKQYYNSLSDELKQKITFESIGEGTHKWNSDKTVIKEPSCTENGLKAQQCSICGAIKEESKEEIAAYGHNWNGGVITKEPTETEDGVRTYTCWRCNGTKDEPIPKLSAIQINEVYYGWNEYNTVCINLSVNKDGSYYTTWVPKDNDAPQYDSEKVEGSLKANRSTRIEVKDLPDEEVDIYVFVKDADGNNTYVKVTPNYFDRPEKPSNKFQIGDDVYATVDGNIMTITGSGETWDQFGTNWYRGDKSKVTEVRFEGNITKINKYLFNRFDSLEKIVLPPSIESIEMGAFAETGFTEFIWPDNVTSISSSTFFKAKLKKFFVPETVTEINTQAFAYCSDLTQISIPKSVKYFGDHVFQDCRNLTIYGYKDSAAERYANNNSIPFVSVDFRVVFKEDGRTQKTEYVTKGQNATPPTLTSRPGYTLSWDGDYTNIQEDMIINAVWTKISSDTPPVIITPPEPETKKYTVTFVDRGKVVKTEKVESGEAAEYPFITRTGYNLSWDKDFSNVTGDITVNAVWTVITPGKVTSLTAEVGKETINLSWDETEYASYYLVYRKADTDKEYSQVAKTTKVLWTDSDAIPGMQYAYKVIAVRSLEGKKYQGEDSDIVTAKVGTPQIGDTYTVGNLNYKVTGDNKVEATGIAKITDTLTIPSSVIISGKSYKVTSIQAKAFYRNEDIVDVKIGNYVTYVGKYSFYRCPNLETVKFGKRVETISTGAFSLCPNLEDVTLPASVKSLGAKAFYHCGSIETMTIKSTKLTYIGKNGLAVSSKTVVKVPKSKYSTYKKMITKSGTYKALKIQEI